MFTPGQQVKTIQGNKKTGPFVATFIGPVNYNGQPAAKVRKQDGKIVVCLMRNLVSAIVPVIKTHSQCCVTCKFYRKHNGSTECILLSKTLTTHLQGERANYLDASHYCEAWTKRPDDWIVHCERSPYWNDRYIPRHELERIRVAYGVEV